MFGFIKRKCTAETLGTIVKKRWNGNLWFITVEYFVEGQSYIVKEQLTYKVEKKYKVGKVPVGMHSTSALKSIDINASVRVKYNPNKPKQSYLPDIRTSFGIEMVFDNEWVIDYSASKKNHISHRCS